MELGNEQLYEKLLWRLLLDFERRPFHLRGRSQESLRFVTLHSSRMCAERERERWREEGNKQDGVRMFFFFFAESDEAGSLHDHWSIRRGELTEGPGDWSRKKGKGKYSQQ